MIMCRNQQLNVKWHILNQHHQSNGKIRLKSTSIMNKVEVKHCDVKINNNKLMD